MGIIYPKIELNLFNFIDISKKIFKSGQARDIKIVEE